MTPKNSSTAQSEQQLRRENEQLRADVQALTNCLIDAYAKTINLYQPPPPILERVAHDAVESIRPAWVAAYDFIATIAFVTGNMRVLALNHAGVHQTLQAQAGEFARVLYENYHCLKKQMALVGREIPPQIDRGATELHEALRDFETNVNAAQRVLQCDAMREGYLNQEMQQSLAGLSFGRKHNPARTWLGAEMAALKLQPEVKTDEEALRVIFKKLIRVQHYGTITPVESDVLAELDTRDRGIFREYGNLPEAVLTYARQARHDYEQSNHVAKRLAT